MTPLDAAHGYLALGWTPIPCLPGDKRPAIEWAAYQTRKPTEAELVQWFGDGKAHNLAIVTGQASGLLVLDIDGASGEASVKGKQIPPTPCVRTANGWHHYYKHPGYPIRNFTRKLPGLDLRADGGYVLAPPSIHPNGTAYEWAIGLDELPLADPPQWLLELCTTPTQPMIPKSRDWVATALQGVGEGQRNDTAARLAGFMRHHFDRGAAEAMLTLWNERNEPPLPQAELAKVLESVWRYEGPRQTHRQTATELLAREFPPMRWVVPDLLPEGCLAILASKAKLGKSWLMLQLAIALACGGHFLGHTLAPGKVCYYALEDGDRLLQERLRLLGASGNLDGLVFLDAIRPLNTPEGMAELEGTITEERPRLLILDTLAAAKTGKLDENLAGDFADLANPLRTLAHDTGTAILLVHHHGKLAGGDAVLDLRGSTALGGAVDTIWGLYRDRGQAQAKLSATGRNILDAELALEFDAESTHCWQMIGNADEVAQSEAESEILEVLAALQEAKAGAIAQELGKSKQAVWKVCEKMAERGLLKREIQQKGMSKGVLYSQRLTGLTGLTVDGVDVNPVNHQPSVNGLTANTGQAIPSWQMM